MKRCTLKDDLERMIYAAAFVAEFNRLHEQGPVSFRNIDDTSERIVKWEANCADNAQHDAETMVHFHRQSIDRLNSKD